MRTVSHHILQDVNAFCYNILLAVPAVPLGYENHIEFSVGVCQGLSRKETQKAYRQRNLILSTRKIKSIHDKNHFYSPVDGGYLMLLQALPPSMRVVLPRAAVQYHYKPTGARRRGRQFAAKETQRARYARCLVVPC